MCYFKGLTDLIRHTYTKGLILTHFVTTTTQQTPEHSIFLFLEQPYKGVKQLTVSVYIHKR